MKQLLSAAAVASVLALTGSTASAALGVDPFIFDPDNLGGVSAAKMENMGCDRNQAGKVDKGLVMFKLGPTSENKSSGASIMGVNGRNFCAEGAMVGFQYRPEGHCGAGAPRFNVTTRDGVTHFIGCSAMTKSAVDPDTGCVTATADVHDGQAFPPIPVGTGNDPSCVVKSMAIVFDEGTDQGPGFAVIDNININGTVIDLK